jgi:microcompartment protein CcmK/EutM
MVGCQTDRAIADALVERDPAGAWNDAQDAVAADAIGAATNERVGDLAGDGKCYERLAVRTRRAGAASA